MKLNRKLFAALLTAAMLLSLLPAASAADLQASYGEAKYQNIAVTAYSKMPDFHGGVVAAQDKAGNWGLIDAAGKAVVPFRYAGVSYLAGDLFRIIDRDGKQGIVDAAGKMVLAPGVREIDSRHGVLGITVNMVKDYYNPDLTPGSLNVYWQGPLPKGLEGYDQVSAMDQSGSYYMVWKGGKIGLTDSTGKVIFGPGEYDGYGVLTNGDTTAFSVYMDSNNTRHCALLSASKQILIPFGTYDDIYSWDSGLFAVCSIPGGDYEKFQMGLVDLTGKVIVPLGDPGFGSRNPQGYLSVATLGSDGKSVTKLYDRSGAVVKTLPGREAYTSAGFNTLIFRDENGLYGLMDQDGKILLAARFDGLYADSGESVRGILPESYTYGLYSPQGKELMPPVYDMMSYVYDKYYLVSRDNRYGMYTPTGKEVIPCTYAGLENINEAMLELYDGKAYTVTDMGGAPLFSSGEERSWLFGSDYAPAVYQLVYCMYNSEKYDGYTGAVMPFCVKTSGGAATYYVDCAAGKVTATLPYAASNINADGLFVYQAANGLYGFGSTKADLSPMAYASSTTIQIDGKNVKLDAYALKDEKGNPTNYLKLRDVAAVLDGTKAQFNVGWDGAVSIEPGKPYTDRNGSELSTPFSGDRAYSVSTAATSIGGKTANLAAITLTDDANQGYTYYKLRDLGEALGFNVTWDSAAGIIKVETNKPYTG